MAVLEIRYSVFHRIFAPFLVSSKFLNPTQKVQVDSWSQSKHLRKHGMSEISGKCPSVGMVPSLYCAYGKRRSNWWSRSRCVKLHEYDGDGTRQTEAKKLLSGSHDALVFLFLFCNSARYTEYQLARCIWTWEVTLADALWLPNIKYQVSGTVKRDVAVLELWKTAGRSPGGISWDHESSCCKKEKNW